MLYGSPAMRYREPYERGSVPLRSDCYVQTQHEDLIFISAVVSKEFGFALGERLKLEEYKPKTWDNMNKSKKREFVEWYKENWKKFVFYYSELEHTRKVGTRVFDVNKFNFQKYKYPRFTKFEDVRPAEVDLEVSDMLSFTSLERIAIYMLEMDNIMRKYITYLDPLSGSINICRWMLMVYPSVTGNSSPVRERMGAQDYTGYSNQD